MPLIDAGARPEETVSLPSPMGAKPAAVVTPEPEEDPEAGIGGGDKICKCRRGRGGGKLFGTIAVLNFETTDTMEEQGGELDRRSGPGSEGPKKLRDGGIGDVDVAGIHD
ncbi:hypothetical protein VDGL01_01596 [Verticillium dahliae]